MHKKQHLAAGQGGKRGRKEKKMERKKEREKIREGGEKGKIGKMGNGRVPLLLM